MQGNEVNKLSSIIDKSHIEALAKKGLSNCMGKIRKKVMIIHHCGFIGGAGVSLLNMVDSLKEIYDVEVYIPNSPSELKGEFQSNDSSVCTYPFRMGQILYYNGGFNLYNPKFWYYAVVQTISQVGYWKNIIKEKKPDLVIVNSQVLCWLGKIFKECNVKSICYVRETMLGNSSNIMNKMIKSMLETFSAVFFISEYDKKNANLKRTCGIVVPDFVEVERYEDAVGRKKACELLKLDENAFNILFVGGVSELKGMHIAVKSMELLKNKQATLIIAGQGYIRHKITGLLSAIQYIRQHKNIQYSRMIEKMINVNELQDTIKFIGIQSDISIAYSASDVLIFPMTKAHQSRPAFEIGVQKKPVVISNFENIKEYVTDGVNGLVFEPGNPEDLAEKIDQLINNFSLKKNLGEKNYERTLQEHGKKVVMNTMIEEIENLLERVI